MDGIASLKASSLFTRLREAQWDVIGWPEKRDETFLGIPWMFPIPIFDVASLWNNIMLKSHFNAKVFRQATRSSVLLAFLRKARFSRQLS